MGAWADFLQTLNPINGRIIAEDGGAWNRADWGRFQQRYDPPWQTVKNGASRLSGRERGIDQAEYWVGIEVPAGRRLIVWEDALKLSENEYNIDVYRAPDGFTGGTQKVKNPLGASGSETVQSVLWFDVTPTDEQTHVQRLEDYIDTGNVQGPGRPTVTPAGDQTFQVVDTHVLIRITRVGTGQAYALSYRTVVWEESIDD